MDQKHIGIILIIVSILMSSFVYVIYSDSEKFADEYMSEKGTCFLEDGTCLHKEKLPLFIFGWVVSGSLLLFGVYLAFIDKTQKFMAEQILFKNWNIRIKYSKTPTCLPTVLTKEEVICLIDSIENKKHKLMISLMYSSGMRLSELINVKVKGF